MKTLLLLALLVSTAHAIQIKDLVGNWSGQRRETINGVGSQYKVTLEATAQNGGVVVKGSGKSPFIGPYKFRQVYSKDGKFSEVMTTSGIILSSGKGTWKIARGKIQISASGGNLGGKTKVSGVLEVIGKSQLKYSGSSNGSKVSFNLKRR